MIYTITANHCFRMTDVDINSEIVSRFFVAIHRLISDKVIRGKQTFTRRYGINRWNFVTLEHEPNRRIFQVSWLAFLVRDYKVSADWLLTGEGDIYQPSWTGERVKIMQNQCNSKKECQQTPVVK